MHNRLECSNVTAAAAAAAHDNSLSYCAVSAYIAFCSVLLWSYLVLNIAAGISSLGSNNNATDDNNDRGGKLLRYENCYFPVKRRLNYMNGVPLVTSVIHVCQNYNTYRVHKAVVMKAIDCDKLPHVSRTY